MKNTYYSSAPYRGLLVILLKTSALAQVVTLQTKNNEITFYNLFYQVCKVMDTEQKALLIDESVFTYPGQSNLATLFGFQQIKDSTILLRRHQQNIDHVGIHVRHFYIDRDDVLHPAVNEDRATHFAVINAYGDRLLVVESLKEAQSFLENSRG